MIKYLNYFSYLKKFLLVFKKSQTMNELKKNEIKDKKKNSKLYIKKLIKIVKS